MLTPYKDPNYGYVGDANVTGNYNFQMPDGTIQQAPYQQPTTLDQIVKALAIAGVGAGFGAGALGAIAPETAASLGVGSGVADAGAAGVAGAGSAADLASINAAIAAGVPETAFVTGAAAPGLTLADAALGAGAVAGPAAATSSGSFGGQTTMSDASPEQVTITGQLAAPGSSGAVSDALAAAGAGAVPSALANVVPPTFDFPSTDQLLQSEIPDQVSTASLSGFDAAGSGAGTGADPWSLSSLAPTSLKGAIQDAGMLGSAGMLLNSALGGSSTGNFPAAKSLGDIASNANSQASQLTNTLFNGQMPPGMQDSIDRATRAAKAAIRSKYAGMGLTKSTMEATELAQIDQNASAMGFDYATKLFDLGLKESAISAELYSALLNSQTNANNQLTASIGNFAAAMLGGNFGGNAASSKLGGLVT